ncbi:hypothetical protein BB561_004807, partial [Smittium simulii]
TYPMDTYGLLKFNFPYDFKPKNKNFDNNWHTQNNKIASKQRNEVPYFEKNPNAVLIMDNCRFHHRLDVKRVLIKKRIDFKFLTPYSPQLNSIEEVFGAIKARYIDMSQF